MKNHFLYGLIKTLICLSVLSGVPACEALAQRDRDTLVYSWPGNVGELNPHMYSPNQMFAQAMVYEPLVRYGEGGSIVPALAERWTISPDGKVYTFYLRRQVVFSDGQPFNAEAVKRNFEAVLANRARHRWLELIAQIDRFEVVDEHTFRLTLKNSYYPTLFELSLVRPLRFLSPASIPEGGSTASGIKKPVGTGPWILAETRKGEYDLFVRNEHYWGKKPRFKKLLVKVITDPNTRAVAMETGEIDLILGTAGGHGAGQISYDMFERFSRDPRYETRISKPMATQVLALNTNRGPTRELAVRTAVLLGVNKAAIVKNVLRNVDRQAETLFPGDVPYCDLGLKPMGYDPIRAARLLDEALWRKPAPGGIRVKGDQSLEIDLSFIGNDAFQKAIAESIQGDLRKIGIRINLLGEEVDSVNNRQRTGEFGMIFNATWGAPYEPHSYLSSMRVVSHADYQAQLGLAMKAEIDARIGRMLLSVNDRERQDLVRWILTTLHEQAVYLPISFNSAVAVYRKELAGVGFGHTRHEIPFEYIERR